jgi:hypothetical protein
MIFTLGLIILIVSWIAYKVLPHGPMQMGVKGLHFAPSDNQVTAAICWAIGFCMMLFSICKVLWNLLP